MAFLEYCPSQTLYQFCSVDGFRGILSSKNIWCSDLKEANDPREIKLGFEHFIAALRFVRENEFKGAAGVFLDRLTDDLARNRDIQQAFCACFSLVKDELPMWNEYGSNYSGVAIGFRPTAITSMPGRIQKAKYVSDNTANDFREVVREIASNFDPNHSFDDVAYWIVASTTALSAITALKHRSWAHEQEVRFIHLQTRDLGNVQIPRAEWSDGTPVYWQKPLSREVQGASVEYKTFPFGRQRNRSYEYSRAIERVVIGPRCTLSKDDVQFELEKNGFQNFEIENSDCQIR
jgi:Protein of unknown function (DUF2971)